jgi:hypothetical protein
MLTTTHRHFHVQANLTVVVRHHWNLWLWYVIHSYPVQSAFPSCFSLLNCRTNWWLRFKDSTKTPPVQIHGWRSRCWYCILYLYAWPAGRPPTFVCYRPAGRRRSCRISEHGGRRSCRISESWRAVVHLYVTYTYTFTYTTWTLAPMFTYTTWTSAACRPHTNTYTDIHTQKQTRVGGNQPDICKDLFRLETIDNSIGKVFLDVPEMLDCTGSYDITVQVSLWLIESWLKVLLN